MGAVVSYYDPGGGGSKGVGKFFQGSDIGGDVVWGGDMGTNPQDGAIPEYFPTQDRATAHREAAYDTEVWDFGVPIIGGSNGGIRLREDWNIHDKETENGRAVCCDANDYGPL